MKRGSTSQEENARELLREYFSGLLSLDRLLNLTCSARSFMRFKSGKVKFVAVDEPSSALDAEGELKLFERLIAAREGKTMVFVTHRFGHLTKHADQIMCVLFDKFSLGSDTKFHFLLISRCMKEGMVAETGTHEQLMELKGEYAKLYNIQASAFAG